MDPNVRNFLSRVGIALPEGNDPILVGVSGGADSVALLRALLMLHRRVVAVHCNFHLRGDESLRDQKFVEDLCRRLQLPLVVRHFNEDGLPSSGSVEDLCRRQRYGLFSQLKEQYGCCRIAVAHNANDNVETLLLNLMRGCGLRGLAAMRVDNGQLLRPLLEITRQEILLFLETLRQPFVTDSSNLESRYRRNFIRNELLPLLATRWPGALESIMRTQRNLLSDEMLLQSLSHSVDSDRLSWEDAAAGYLYHWASRRGVRAVVVEEMKDAVGIRKSGLRWFVSGGEVLTSRHGFEFVPEEDFDPSETVIGLPSGFAMMPVDADVQMEGNDVLYIAAQVDCEPYRWRHPRPGDAMQPLGMDGRRQKVAKIMKDADLSLSERKKQWLLENAATGDIIWLPGLKRSIHEQLIPSGESAFNAVYRLK